MFQPHPLLTVLVCISENLTSGRYSILLSNAWYNNVCPIGYTEMTVNRILQLLLNSGLIDCFNRILLLTCNLVSLVQDLIPRGLAFNNNGTKCSLLEHIGNDVNEYTLSTGY